MPILDSKSGSLDFFLTSLRITSNTIQMPVDETSFTAVLIHHRRKGLWCESRCQKAYSGPISPPLVSCLAKSHLGNSIRLAAFNAVRSQQLSALLLSGCQLLLEMTQSIHRNIMLNYVFFFFISLCFSMFLHNTSLSTEVVLCSNV